TISLIDPGFWTRFGVHYGLFFGALRGSATSSQFSHWVSKGALALNGMVGCFAMTELGHGSNVAGLETTATFDEAADQFIIHTPTVTATKWWIGGAAHTATHCVVFAQLIVRGKRYGTKSFVVQLRDTHTYTLMPGVNIGDIGKKMGRDGIDNGWIQFTNVRVPRMNMLMKHTKVSRAGEVKEPPMAQLTYGALIQGRVAMVVDSGNIAKKAVTIAGRYAAVRRQFSSSPHDIQETKLIDYAIHQYRLMPLLAMAYAFHFTGVETQKLYDHLMDKLESTQPNDASMQEVLDTLKETHATSAGLKAFCTWSTLNAIEACRQTLGGHGYSAYTGLATTYNDFAVHCTWEGDNTILTLQSGRYLVSCYREALAGKAQPEGVSYLNNLDSLLNLGCGVKSNEGILNFDIIQEAWNVVTANVVKKAGDDFENSIKQGLSPEAAYEECSQA
ncbi:fatty-acyl coenzyme A oxidase, partial [Haplosporangium bisporale]